MSVNIANTIWKQLNAGGIMKVLCWGVPLKSRVGQDEPDGSGFLRFEVNGHNLKGIVKIIYKPVPDSYTVEFYKRKKVENEYNLKETDYDLVNTLEDIGCDQLTEVIDEYVEKIPAYNR